MKNEEGSVSTDKKVSGIMKFLFIDVTFAFLLTGMLTVGGLMGYNSMVKESKPDIDIPQATIQVPCPGMDAESVEKDVVNVLEDEIKATKGLKRLRSASHRNVAILAVEFGADEDSNIAIDRLRAAVSEAEGRLPSGAGKPSIIQKTVDDRPILAITMFGDINPALLGKTAKMVEDRLIRVPGVREVNLAGRRKEQVVIQVIRKRLEALGLSVIAVQNAIQQANQDSSWQRFEGKHVDMPLRFVGKFKDLEALRNLPIARFDESRVVYLWEVANIYRTLEKEMVRTSFSIGGEPYKPCIDVSIIKSSGSDTVRTIEALKAELELIKLSKDWPPDLKYAFTTDQSVSIWDDLIGVLNNAWQAMLAVFIVLLIMLSWREAIIASFCIPITFMGALLIVWGLGYSLNELVIIGMVLALGLLVDVFILMMEGMHEGVYVRKESLATAAITTVKTYAGPAFAGQMTTILAMAPLMVIAGTQGKFIRVIPVTAIICLIVSFIVALLASVPFARLLMGSADPNAPTSTIDKVSARSSEALRSWLKAMILPNRWVAAAIVGVGLVLFGVSVKLSGYLPSELYPSDDDRDLALTIEMEPNTPLDVSQRCADAIGEVIRKKTYFENTVKFVGQRSPMSQGGIMSSLEPSAAPYISGFTCRFTHSDEREKMSLDYIAELRVELAEVIKEFPGATLRFIFSSAAGGADDPVVIVLYGDDSEKLRSISEDVQEALRDVAGSLSVRDVRGQLEMRVTAVPDREAISFHGLSERDFGDQISFTMGPKKIGSYPMPGDQENLDITLSAEWESRNGALGGPTKPSEGREILVMKHDGTTLPLRAIANLRFEQKSLLMFRDSGRRATIVSCKTDGATTGEVLKRVGPALEELKKGWPSGYAYKISGEAEDAAETFGSAAVMLVVALFLVFALLLVQFNSVSQPFIIMLTVPLALIGTLSGFFLAGYSMSFPAMIGIISLIGIVVNNAIVMIDTMNTHLKAGLPPAEAAARGAADRLRPILSTTVTTLVGLVPLAISSPMWMPLCGAIIFGLMTGTVSAFIMIPAAFYVLTRTEEEATS